MWSTDDQMSWGNSMNRKRPYTDVNYDDEADYNEAYGPSQPTYQRNSYNDSNFGYNNNWNSYEEDGGPMGPGHSFGRGHDDSSFAEDIPLEGNKRYQSQPFQFQGGFRGQNDGKRGGRGGGRGKRGGGFDGNQGGFGGRGGGRGRGGGSFRGGNRGQQGNQNRGGGGRGNRGMNFGNQGGRGGNRGGRGGNMQKKPGLPPQKVFGGPGGGQGGMKGKRGKGNQIGGPMAPVHSLSKVATQPVDTANMSTAEKIHRFALFVQGEPMKVNAIQTIENAITGSKLNLKTQYEVEELMRVSGKWMFTGRLVLSGIFLARAVGANKKEVKHETYQKALDVLKSKTVAEIFNLADPGADAIRNELSSTLDTNKDVNKQAATILEKKAAKFAAINTNQEGFMCLVDYLRESDNLPESKVSAIEQALAASHCGLSHSYDFKASRLPSGRFFFHGILKVGDVIIAIGKGYKKKDAKVDTYAVAFSNLMTKTVQELMAGIELESEMQVDNEKNLPFHMEPDARKLSLPEKIERMIQTLKDSNYKENNINTMDVLAASLGLTKTCVYRKSESITPGEKPGVACDLYLENILIASGEGEKRKDAQVDAYNVAWETLCTTSGERVIKDHRRLKPEDSNDPTVIDVYVKGTGKPNGDSNMAGLKRNNFDTADTTKTVDTMVILEHEDWTIDRKRQAFCILNYSATMNGILLEWQIEPEGNMFRCTVQLQGQIAGEAYAMSKHNSRNLAAADSLFKLYESHDVIKVTRRDDSQLWIPYETIKRKADSMEEESGETAEPEEPPATTDGDGDTKTEGDSKTDSKPPLRQPNKWVLAVAKGIVEEYKDQFTLEELIFGPGMPLCESKEVRNLARSSDIKHDVRQLDGQSYLVIHHKMTPQNMAKCLKQYSGASGKYVLVDHSVLPSHADIVPDLEKQLQLGGNLVGLKSNFQSRNMSAPQKQGFQPKFLQDNTKMESMTTDFS